MLYLCIGKRKQQIMDTITCTTNKPCFITKFEVKDYIYRRNLRNGGDSFHFYYCHECGCYHLTTHTVYGEQMIRKSAHQYNRLKKKSEDNRILKVYGLI